MNYLETFKAARRASVPLIVIRCPDYAAVMREITNSYKVPAGSDKPEAPVLQWDISQGVCGINIAGEAAAAMVNRGEEGDTAASLTGDPIQALQRSLEHLPPKSILFFLNGHLLLEANDPLGRLAAVQCMWNLRDQFKSDGRTLAILCPDIKLPVELRNDVIVLDVDLPGEDELKALVADNFRAAGFTAGPNQLEKSVAAVSGLSHFIAENSIAMALRKDGSIDTEALWGAKIKAIEQTAGLKVSREQASFDKIGGLAQAKKYLRYIINGKRKPKLIVLIDEIGDQLAGQNDSNGLNADAQSQMLQEMENNHWRGALFHGFSGTGKTELGKAMGCESGGLFLWFDMGSTRGGLVGDSERMIRAAMKILKAMGGTEVFFIGTTNSTANLTPQIKRRFGTTFFFDLLTAEEQAPIWDIYKQKFNLGDQPLPPCKGWTGAEIKNVCEKADEFGISLIEAAPFISPIADSMGDGVKAMRASAAGKCLSATTPGFYKPKQPITLEDVKRSQENN